MEVTYHTPFTDYYCPDRENSPEICVSRYAFRMISDPSIPDSWCLPPF